MFFALYLYVILMFEHSQSIGKVSNASIMELFGAHCVCVCVFSRLWQVVHHDGLRRAAWSDSSPLQLPVQQDCAGDAGGRELHGGSLLHGDLQRESPRPARPQRVRTVSLSVTLGKQWDFCL